MSNSNQWLPGLAPFETVMLAVTCVASVWLLLRSYGYTVSKEDKFQALRFTEDTASNRGKTNLVHRVGRSRDGFSNGGMEAPVFHYVDYNADSEHPDFQQQQMGEELKVVNWQTEGFSSGLSTALAGGNVRV